MAQNFSAFFIFGDSLVDVGNNNYIASIARADHDPIGDLLGFKSFPPPYLAPTTVGPVLLQGVNYASGASGILDESGANWLARIPMDAQLENFAKTKLNIISSIGAPATNKLFTTALYQVTTSSNDFINNYFLPSLKERPPPETFIRTMISSFRRQLTKLYDLGARKIMVTNAPPIGCIPYERDYDPSGGQECVASQNLVAQQYNKLLKGMLIELTTTLKGSRFIYADVYRIVEDIIQNYRSYGFEIVDTACCNVLGSHGGLLPCLPHAKICPDRTKYVFWDSYHVSDSVNVIIAKRLMDGDFDDISPVNIRALSHT
ncbi:hypothetical protein L1887_28376 [Cichorium endivia]|nr:hypothetical protein L1887_28376 [Cichorium endivia]